MHLFSIKYMNIFLLLYPLLILMIIFITVHQEKTDYENAINEIKKALNNGIISEDLINKLAFRNIAWKYYKRLIKTTY